MTGEREVAEEQSLPSKRCLVLYSGNKNKLLETLVRQVQHGAMTSEVFMSQSLNQKYQCVFPEVFTYVCLKAVTGYISVPLELYSLSPITCNLNRGNPGT